ncbi:MAG TPA: prolyl oligopeptidase family serine peptidase [Gemmatimonadaceae bacterium]|nr:prolyl oligopeptidase family serine peptidase [Gemmatimonadaceae bacterium]
MLGPQIYGREPQQVRWTADGRWLYFMWNAAGTDWREPLRPHRVRPVEGAVPEQMSEAHMDSVGPLLQPGRPSPDRRRRVVSYQGDLYLVDEGASVARRLTETVAAETDPDFGADGRRVYFVRDNNVFSLELEGGLVRQLTDIRSGPAPREPARGEGQRGTLEAQQRELFDVIRDRARADSATAAARREREGRRTRTVYLNANERVTSLAVSPNGRALLVATTVPNERALQTRVPNYVTASGYTEDLTSRTKVGDAQSAGRLLFLSLPSGDLRVLRATPGDTTRPPAFAAIVGWNERGDRALVSTLSADFKTRWLHTVSADSGALRTVATDRDTAWVAGPCFNCAGWLPGGDRLWYVSEADGWAHLYSLAADGSDRRQLTRGRFEVYGVALSRDRRHFHLSTSEKSPYERHFYRMPIAGGAREQITTRVGGHTVALSPDESMLADVFSEANRPPELFVTRNRAGAPMAQLTTSPTREWLAQRWIVPPIVTIPASDGVGVPARLYRPQDVGAAPNGAAVIFVHGAGYLHNVHNYWSDYAREYQFHHLLASRGYVVLDLDYRGSAGYGRDWRTAIYRHMGGRDLQDHVDASRWLAREHGISPERVGIYGGSYGGFITLMALFTEPEHFGAGAALRSVTDWAHYNHPYTGRILNLPQGDSVAYRRSSPIYHAQGLADPLLMAHGMVDVNVHFSDIVRLTQRLIELGKSGWELAVYPVEDHAFVRPDSWTDEYRRILELFDRHLSPERARPATTDGDGGTR